MSRICPVDIIGGLVTGYKWINCLGASRLQLNTGGGAALNTGTDVQLNTAPDWERDVVAVRSDQIIRISVFIH